MRSRDKNNLIISGVLIAVLMVVACFWFGTRQLPLYLIAGVVLLIEVVYVMPSVCKLYYEWYGTETAWAYVPYMNIIQCMPSAIAISSIALTVLGCLCIVFLKLPSFVHRLFGENFMIDYADVVPYYGVVMLLIVSILWGIGYIRIYREVKTELQNAGVLSAVSNALFMVTLLVPAIRVIGLVMLQSDLKAVLNVVYADDDDGEFEELDYEE